MPEPIEPIQGEQMPEDKINFDELLTKYKEVCGVDPSEIDWFQRVDRLSDQQREKLGIQLWTNTQKICQ